MQAPSALYCHNLHHDRQMPEQTRQLVDLLTVARGYSNHSVCKLNTSLKRVLFEESSIWKTEVLRFADKTVVKIQTLRETSVSSPDRKVAAISHVVDIEDCSCLLIAPCRAQ
eukprot:428911-Hanusia_phi.AAC.1